VRDQVLFDAIPAEVVTRRWSSFVGPVLAVYALSRLVVFGTVLDAYGGRWTATKFAGTWDGRYYLKIAAHGYPAVLPRSNPVTAFFPLFPLVLRCVAPAFGGNLAVTGLVVSFVTGATACLAVAVLARDRAGDEVGVRAGWLMAVAPGAAFLSPAYAEGLAITLCVVALVLLDRRRWGAAGAIGALATATSPLAFPIVVAATWAAWRARRPQAYKAPLMAPLGAIAYFLYLWARMGTPFGWFDAERVGWRADHLDFLAPIHWLIRSPAISAVETLCLVGAGAGLWAMGRARVPGTWWAFTLPFLASVVFDGGVWLTPRLLLSAVPLVPAVAMATNGRHVRVLGASSAAVMVLFLVAYTQASTGFIFQP
jgi:hypothetical protein